MWTYIKTDKQTNTQTDTTENNITLVSRVIIIITECTRCREISFSYRIQRGEIVSARIVQKQLGGRAPYP